MPVGEEACVYVCASLCVCAFACVLVCVCISMGVFCITCSQRLTLKTYSYLYITFSLTHGFFHTRRISQGPSLAMITSFSHVKVTLGVNLINRISHQISEQFVSALIIFLEKVFPKLNFSKRS